MDELDAFLDQGTTSPEPQPEVTEPPQPETIGQPRDEHGRFAPKETGVEPQEPPAEPVPPTGDKLPPETFKAVKEEREKRQALERELAALKEQFQATQQPPAAPPSIWEDDQAALQHVQQASVSQASFNARLDMSEMLASQAHDDFDAKKAKFLEMMSVNPALQQQVLASRHPWEEAYKLASNAMRFEEMGATDVAALEAKIREQIKAEMAATQPTPAPVLPTSLADSQSARVSQTGAPQLLSLEDILKR